MMTKGMELKNDDLMMVCGGDNWDCYDDNDEDNSWYHVGDSVPYYVSFFHVFTILQIIRETRWNGSYWEYKIIDYRNNEVQWLTASDFDTSER